MGSSFQAESPDETLATDVYKREEYVPGILQNTPTQKREKFDLVLGLRGDHHNRYGFFYTPPSYQMGTESVDCLKGISGQGTTYFQCDCWKHWVYWRRQTNHHRRRWR